MDEDDISTRKGWLDYISKLNDRVLIRQRASGATTWAVAGVVTVLFAKSLACLPSITVNANSALLYLTAVSGTFNILFFGGLLLIFLASVGTAPAEARLKSRLNRASEPMVFGALCMLLVVAASSNIATAMLTPFCLNRWPFGILGSFYALNAITHAASKVRSWIKHRKHIADLPILAEPPFLASSQWRIAFYAAGVSMAAIGFCVAAIPAFQSIRHITTDAHVDALRWALSVVGMVFLGMFLCFRLASRRLEVFLEQLERRIILESLTPESIRSEFIREYLGEGVRDWLAKAEGSLKRLHEEFLQAASNAEKQFVELAKIDRAMQFEITGRKKMICEASKKTVEAYIEYSKKLQGQIKHLTDQNAPVNCPDLFKQILKDWKCQFDSIELRYQALCDVCSKACEGNATAEPCASEVRPAQSDGRP